MDWCSLLRVAAPAHSAVLIVDIVEERANGNTNYMLPEDSGELGVCCVVLYAGVAACCLGQMDATWDV